MTKSGRDAKVGLESRAERRTRKLRASETGLRKNEIQLLGILDSTADGILAVDLNGKVLRANQRFADMWRIPQSLLESKDDRTLLNYVLAQLREPDAFLAKVQVLYESDAEDLDILFFKDGRVFERHSSPLKSKGLILGRVWSFHDVTERIRAEEALRASEERFRDLAKMSSHWLWEQDAQFRFTAVSGDLYEKAHLSPGATLGKTRWELPAIGVSQAQWKAHWALLEGHQAFEKFVYQLRNDDGELRWVSITGKPVFGPDGTFCGYRGTGHDITEQVNRDRKLRQTQRMEAVGRLAAGIAHDFNNMLAAIVGNERLARADLAPDDPAQESLREIEKGALRAQDLIRQLLTFSQPHDTQRKALDSAAVVGDALRLLRATLPAIVEIGAEYEHDLPAMLADASAISQVIMSLGTNAAEAMKGAGRIEVTVKAMEMQQLPINLASGTLTGPCVCIAVSDTGIGMDAQTRERIFEPFFTTKESGAGLGLSVVHGIVRDLEGAIAVESEPGRGTTFFVYFPACLPAPDAGDTAGLTQDPSASTTDSLQILLVDDEESLVFLAQRIFRRLGHRVEGFQDPAQALAAFERDPQAFDLVVTDLAMPHMNGLDLAQRILAIRPGLRIVVMSGYIREKDELRARALGITDLHWKPNSVEELAQILRTRIGESGHGE